MSYRNYLNTIMMNNTLNLFDDTYVADLD